MAAETASEAESRPQAVVREIGAGEFYPFEELDGAEEHILLGNEQPMCELDGLVTATPEPAPSPGENAKIVVALNGEEHLACVDTGGSASTFPYELLVSLLRTKGNGTKPDELAVRRVM